jgi:3-hydroxyacyl-[acyl-carrier-protein] dehydratase
MPRQLLFDLEGIDLDKPIFDQKAIQEVIPHRGDMEMLNGIVHFDVKHHRLIGYKNVRLDEFWVPGHIPGRPILPGVLMLESAAQLASFYASKAAGWTGFVGFGGVDSCRFRQQVVPPARLYLLCQQAWHRHGRLCCDVQGLVNGIVVFETQIIGAQI